MFLLSECYLAHFLYVCYIFHAQLLTQNMQIMFILSIILTIVVSNENINVQSIYHFLNVTRSNFPIGINIITVLVSLNGATAKFSYEDDDRLETNCIQLTEKALRF